MKVWKPNRLGWIELRSLILRRPWSLLSWSTGLMAMAFILYYGLQAVTSPQIGAQFVLAEWPDPKFSPYFYAKPITWFSYLSFLYWAFGLEAQKEHFLNLSERIRRFIFIVAAVIAFGAFYEIFFNFMLWSALEVLTQNCLRPPCNPDQLANSFPVLRNPVNLVFATKVVTTVFGIAIYQLWFLHRLEKETERRNQTPQPISRRQDLYEVEPIRANQMTLSNPSTTEIERRRTSEPLSPN